jgi:excisionase family DNA binding protein
VSPRSRRSAFDVHPTKEEPVSNKPNLIDIEAVAIRLGVSVRHVRRLVNEKRIPYIKWGHNLHFDPDEIDAWIEEHRQRPQSA